MVAGRVKGETVARIWKTFRLRGHDRRVTGWVPRPLVEKLEAGEVLANAWYPIEDYLALYGALLRVAGRDEVVATAADSVLRGLRAGSWKVFVPVLANLAPETFCQTGVKRLELVWKQTFEPGEAKVEASDAGSATAVVRGAPWSADEAWRAGVCGGLIAIPQYAGLDATCGVVEAERGGAVRFQVKWAKKR